ncbi:MAG: efflux RND transporter periplasmic adaptor subunit [Gammaproteobacteria bacterium]
MPFIHCILTLSILLIYSCAYAEEPVEFSNTPEIRTQLTAKSVLLSSELAGKISQLKVKEGESFRKGQLLVSLNCIEQQAKLNKAKVIKQSAERVYSVNSRLSELNSVSVLDLELTKTELLKANADIKLMTAVLTKCTIHAPFSGRVAEQYAEQYQYLNVGKPILDIIDDNQLTLTLLVPSNWLVWLKEGQRFNVFLEETQIKYPAKVTLIGARIDPVSQSIKIKGEIIGKFEGLLAGMSGRAFFNQAAIQ